MDGVLQDAAKRAANIMKKNRIIIYSTFIITYDIFTFEKSNVMFGTSAWRMKVTTIDNRELISYYSLSYAKESWLDCTLNNKLSLPCKENVYLMKIRREDLTDDDLRNYCIVVTNTNPETFVNDIKEIILNAITYS